MKALQIIVLSFGVVIFTMSAICLGFLYKRKRDIEWANFDKDKRIIESLNSSLWSIANICLYGLVTMLTSTS